MTVYMFFYCLSPPAETGTAWIGDLWSKSVLINCKTRNFSLIKELYTVNYTISKEILIIQHKPYF